MIDLSFERTMDKTFMIIKELKENSKDAYEYKMIRSNVMSCILSMELQHINDTTYYYYDITSLLSLKEIYCNKLLGYSDVITYIKGMIEALVSSKKYLLKEENFIIIPETIYYSAKEEKIKLAYMIGHEIPMKEQLGSLMEIILKYIDYKDERAIVLTYNLYLACKEDTCTYEHLLQLLNKENAHPTTSQGDNAYSHEKESEEGKIPVRNRVEEIIKVHQDDEVRKSRKISNKISSKMIPPVIEERIEEEMEVLEYDKKVYLWLAVLIIGSFAVSFFLFQTSLFKIKLRDTYDIAKVSCYFFLLLSVDIYVGSKVFGWKQKIVTIKPAYRYVDTRSEEKQQLTHHESIEDMREVDITECLTVNEEEYTQVLNSMECEARLIPIEDNNVDTILLNKFPFSIGKKNLKADYVLDYKVISRVHAKIVKAEGGYFIMDLQSTNGTFVNGTRIESLHMVVVHQGDRISFADLHYQLSIG